MNYYERLVRRALARAAGMAEPLRDPFDETAPWELEVPRPVPSMQPMPAPAASPPPPVRDGDAPTQHPTKELEVRALDEVRAALPQSRIEHEVAAADTEPPARAIDPLPPPLVPAEIATSQDAELRALEHADAFMRALGVTMPQLAPAEPVAGTLEAMVAEAMPALQEAQRQPPPGDLQPPAAVVPSIVATPDAHEPPQRAIAAPPGSRDAQARRAGPALIERRQVVVVTQHDGGAGEYAGTTGAGAPRFGLGQL